MRIGLVRGAAGVHLHRCHRDDLREPGQAVQERGGVGIGAVDVHINAQRIIGRRGRFFGITFCIAACCRRVAPGGGANGCRRRDKRRGRGGPNGLDAQMGRRRQRLELPKQGRYIRLGRDGRFQALHAALSQRVGFLRAEVTLGDALAAVHFLLLLAGGRLKTGKMGVQPHERAAAAEQDQARPAHERHHQPLGDGRGLEMLVEGAKTLCH